MITTLEDNLAFLYTYKQTLTIWSSSYVPCYLTKLIKNLCPYNFEHKCLLQIYWASLVAQLVKNPPAMQETAVRFLDEEGSLEKGMATHASILAWRILWTA